PYTLNGAILPPDDSGLTPGAAWYDDVEHHLTLTSGAWPDGAFQGGAWPVAVSETGADLLALHSGDVLCLRMTGLDTRQLCVRLAGPWRPVDAHDPYWGAGVPVLTFLVTEPEMVGIARSLPALPVRAGALLTPVRSAIPYERAEATADALNRLRGAFSL